MATPPISSTTDSTDTARFAHGWARKASTMDSPAGRRGVVSVSDISGQSTGAPHPCKGAGAPFLPLDSHRGRRSQLDVAQHRPDQRHVGGGPVADLDANVAARFPAPRADDVHRR